MKRYLAALAIGGAVFGTVLASAASLGDITDGTLGASDKDVAACQASGLKTEYVVAWDGTTNDRYEVTGVEVNGISAACAGKRIGIVLVDTDGNKLAENDATTTGDHLAAAVEGATYPAVQAFSLTPTTSHPSVADVKGVHLAVYGD